MEISSKERRFMRLDGPKLVVDNEIYGITFHLEDGTVLQFSVQELFDLLMYITELKNSSEQRRREILGD